MLKEITPEVLERWQQVMDKVATIPDVLGAIEKRTKALEDAFGAIPKHRGAVPLPGGRAWGSAESLQDGKELSREFIDWCRCVWSGKPLPGVSEQVTRALTEVSDAGGGYLVPEMFIPEVLRIINLVGVMRPLVRVVPMASDVSNIPSLTSSMTVYWPAENQTITQSDPVFGRVPLLAKTMAALTSASIELEDDNAVDLAGLLVTLFAEAIANEEDKQLLIAYAAPFTGLLRNTSVVQVTMAGGMQAFSNVTWQNVSDLIDAVTTAAKNGARFFQHRNITNYLRKVRDANHQYIWAPPVGNQPPTIWGYPYTECDQLPAAGDTATSTNFMAFGNPKYLLLGDRKRYTVARSSEAGFKQNETFWKVTERIACAVGVPTAFAKLRTAA